MGTPQPVSVKVYDISGRVVMDVAQEARRAPGLYRVRLDLTNSPSGVYFLRLAAGSQTEVRRIVRIQ